MSKRNPFAGVIKRAMQKPTAIVLPDTPDGRAQAERQLRETHGDRLIGIYTKGGFRGRYAHLTAYYPRLRAANG